MNGRLEHDIKNNNKALALIEGKPTYMMEYYNSFNDSSTSITRVNYIRGVNQFLDWLKANGVININDINEFKKVKPSTVSNYMASLRNESDGKSEIKTSSKAAKYYAVANFMKFLMYNEYIERNPCDRMKPPKITEQPKVVALDADEIKELRSSTVNRTNQYYVSHDNWQISRDDAIIALGCTTGLRVSSITEINMDDIEMNRDDLWIINVIEKGNKRRQVMVGAACIGTLKGWIANRNRILGDRDVDALFINNRRQRINPQSIQKMIKKSSKGINKHVTPHKMRSTCATNLYNQTGDIYLVQNVLGHSNISNTRRYTSVSKNKAVEATKVLDGLL